MILNAEQVMSDQQRTLLEMALKNAKVALDTVDILFGSLCVA
jgi:hypothetical protein